VKSDQVVIRPLDIASDAEGLAKMWNESDLAWPGTWSDGIPITPDTVREWEEDEGWLVAYVAQVGAEIVGYCSFLEGSGQHKGEGYLAVLNVSPRFHGRSIGRRLIQATIDRSVQEGWKRQTLGTWSANFKAVPAYKRTGHFWTPDSSVWMQNFIPGALQLSLAKPFFARHDWYKCYVREIRQEWDDQRWEGLRVFTQHWEAEGESLTIWIDREAREPVAVETDALQIAAIVNDIEPLAGSKVKVTWRLINKGCEPVRVYLHATGDKGLAIDHRDAFEAAPGETVARHAEIEIADDAPSKKDDGTAPAVHSILRINDDDLDLYSGVRPRKPIRVDTAPEQITTRSGVPQTVRLQIHSELDRESRITARLTPPAGLTTDWTERQIQLPAKGHAGIPLTVTADHEAVYRLPLRIERHGEKDEKPKPVSESITLFVLDVGGMLVQRDGESVRIENDALRLCVSAKEAKFRVQDKVSRSNILSLTPRVGPPFRPSEFSGKTFTLDVRQEGVRAIVRLSAEAEHHPGTFLHEEIAFSPCGLGRVSLWLENRGSETLEKRLGLSAAGPDREYIDMALPLRQGLVFGPAGHYPSGWDDASRAPQEYAEPWIAWEYKGTTAGVAWDESVARISLDRSVSVDSAPKVTSPGSRSPVVSYTFYCGRGDWREARRALIGQAESGFDSPVTRTPVQGAITPRVVATTSDRVTARLVISSTSKRVASGTASVSVEGGVSVDPASVPIEALQRGAPTETEVRFAFPGTTAGVYEGFVRTQVEHYDVRHPFTLVRLGTDEPVTVTEDRREGQVIWTVDNGLYPFVLAPGFGPSVISWEQNGRNQLYSYFPHPAGFAWAYPWFGGIHAILFPAGSWVWEGYLHRERVSAAPISALDGQGNTWQGVRASITPAKKEFKDLAIELDYLTVGASNVMKLVYRVRNLRPTSQRARLGYFAAASLGSDPKALTGLAKGVTRRPTVLRGWAPGRHWAAVTNEATGQTLLMVGKQRDVSLEDFGQAGRILGALDDLRLEGDETHERIHYLVLADTPEQASGYVSLKDI